MRPAAWDAAAAAALVVAAFAPDPPPFVTASIAAVFFAGIGRLSWRVSRWLLPGESRATTATAALVLLAAAWTTAATALGSAGVLTPRAVFLLAALLLLVSARTKAGPPAPRVPRAPRSREGVALLLALAFFAATVLFAAVSERNTPPGARAYDDTSYHLTAVATWRYAHDLRSVKFPTGDGSTAFYPIAGELFSFLLLLPFGGNDVLARWSEVPFALGSLVALASLARLLFLSEEAAGLAVLLYAASPRVFPAGMLSAGNDHAVAFFVLSSAAGALLLRRDPGPRRAVFLGASLGMLVATKYTGAMFLPALLVLAGVCAATAFSGEKVRAAVLSVLAGAATMLSVGGYVYLRNARATGNPFYPATVRAFSRVVLPGWTGDTIGGLWTAGGSGREALRFLRERADLLGPLFPWVLLPAAILAPLVALLTWATARSRRGRAAEVVLFALPAVLYLTFVRLMADHRDIRYVFGALALSSLAAAWLLERLPPRIARFGRAAVLVAVSAALVASARAYLVESRRPAPGPDAAAAFLDRTSPAGSTIAFCGGNQPYPFFGSRLQNRLLFVPTYRGPGAPGISAPLGASFFTWGGPLEFPRHRLAHGEWRENLRLLHVGYVAVVRTGDEFPERDWIAIEPDAFTRVFRDARTEVFAFRDMPLRADRLRVDFARADSDYFARIGGRIESEGGFLEIPASGVELTFPALDAPASALRLEGSGPLTARLNGRALEATDARPSAFRIESSAWRRGRNRISLAPAEGETAAVRLSTVELALDAAHPNPGGGSGELPGNLDVPADGAAVPGDVLAASGWCRERGGGRIDVVRFEIDGREAIPLRASRTDRPGLVAAFPAVVEARETGFAADLDVRGLAPGAHELLVELETPDGRRRTLPPRSFRVVR